MNEILCRYNQGKFQKCLDLIKLLPPEDNLVNNLIIQNCSLMCCAIISILENNENEKSKIEEQLYVFFNKVTSIGNFKQIIPLELKLTALFNYFYWIVFCRNENLSKCQCEKYLGFVNRGLLNVLGDHQEPDNHLNVAENIIKSLKTFLMLAMTKNHKCVFLSIELTVIVLMYIAKLKKENLQLCASTSSIFLINLKEKLLQTKSDNKLQEKEHLWSYLFKFGLNQMTAVFSDLNAAVCDYLEIIKSTFLYLLGNIEEALQSIQNILDTNRWPLVNYLGALCAYKLNKRNKCFTYLQKIDLDNIDSNLKARFLILNGHLYSENDHKKALNYFQAALGIPANNLVSLFCIGSEWGKIGVYDIMLQHFENVVEVIQNSGEEKYIRNFENTIADWIHSDEKISEVEAFYALAVSCGLNERYIEAANAFERVLQHISINMFDKTTKINSLFTVPHKITILHEASVASFLAGNLSRAEEIALEAICLYIPQKFELFHNKKPSVLNEDSDWLQGIIKKELLGFEEASLRSTRKILFSDELVFFLPHNIIALMIVSEVQKIKKSTEYLITLKKIFCCFSTYLSTLNKNSNLEQEDQEEEKEKKEECEKYILHLIKALTSKTCLWIAEKQIQEKNLSNAKKMFKRALSCNKGDKDVLYSYCTFLIRNEEKKEALKLWQTFWKEELVIRLNSLQSLSLRYILNCRVNVRELEKLQRELGSEAD